MRTFACLLAVLGAACAAAGDADVAETEVSPELESKADAAGELSVRAGDTTLWVSKTIQFREGPNGKEFVLRGRTSRTLTDGYAFIFDDVYGAFEQKSPRVFETMWSLGEVRSLVDGVDQFIRMTFAHSSTRPDSLTARAVVRPRLGEFTGSSKIYLVAELTPVVVAGEVVYRIYGRTYGANREIRLVVDNADVGVVTRDGDERFSIDLTPRLALQLIESNTDLQVIADFATGGVDKHGKLGLGLKKLGMTAGDVEVAWPPAACAAATKSCLTALPKTALDLGSCGEAIKVNACANQVGVFVDDVGVQAKLQLAGQRLATPAARADAIALVGTARADQWLGGAEQQLNAELEGMYGRWFLGATTRDGQLALAVERGFDTAYARALDYVTPTEVIPGNAAAMRNVAADAVLAELARMDFVHTEMARSLETLVREYRSQHLASIKAFRETITPEPYMTTKNVFVGDWLGLYTEVVVDRASGHVEQTLVEID